MPIFEYRALTTTGKARKGIIDADTARDARVKLRSDHVHVTDMREIGERAKRAKKKKGARAETTFRDYMRLERRVNWLRPRAA